MSHFHNGSGGGTAAPDWLQMGRISFSTEYTSTKMKTFAVDESMLKTLMEGSRLHLKGVGDDDLVICTDARTYAVKMVENSNMQLICSTITPSVEVTVASSSSTTTITPASTILVRGNVGGCHELQPIAPRVFRIRELLDIEPYAGPLQEAEEDEELRLETEVRERAFVETRKAGKVVSSEYDDEVTLEMNRILQANDARVGSSSLSSSSRSVGGAAGAPHGGNDNDDDDGSSQQQQQQQQNNDGDDAEIDNSVENADNNNSNNNFNNGNINTQELDFEDPDHEASSISPAKRARKRGAKPFKKTLYDGTKDGLRAPREGKGFTFEELLCLVQASAAELREGLNAIFAVETPEKRWRLLDPNYVSKVLESILNSLTARGEDTEGIKLEALVEDIGEEHPPHVVKHVAKMHGEVVVAAGTGSSGGSGGGSGGGGGSTSAPVYLVNLDPVAVAIRRGVSVLQAHAGNSGGGTTSTTTTTASTTTRKSSSTSTSTSTSSSSSNQALLSLASNENSMTIPAFLRAWTRDMGLAWPATSTREVPELSVSLLRGQVLVDTTSSGGASSSSSSATTGAAAHTSSSLSASSAAQTTTIRYFPRDCMHHDPTKRFAQLFAVRSRWEGEEIKPFLEPLVTRERKLDDMLLANARMTVGANKSRSYTAREHGTATGAGGGPRTG